MSDSGEIIKMIERGGVFYNVAGSKPDEVFADAVPNLPLPDGISANLLLAGLREREGLMTTSVGNGIALPHPRTPLVSTVKDERIFVCFLDHAINFGAMDGKPVYVLFILLSSGSQSHLRALSRLSYLFQQETFRTVLRNKPDMGELVAAIKKHL